MDTTGWDHQHFETWVRQRLRQREWTQADLARKLGVPNSTVARWLNGKRRPTSESCDLIADVLGADLDQVLALTGHRPNFDAIPVDDPRATIIALVRRVNLDDQERFEHMLETLQRWIRQDRERSGG
jgi:transcriptional regulator with XRE-family HTH domain